MLHKDNEFLELLQKRLAKHGQANFDYVTATFKHPKDVRYSPDLIFLNDHTDKGICIEYKATPKGYSLPIGLLTTLIDYKEKIEKLNSGFVFVLIAQHDLSEFTVKMIKRLSIRYYSMDEYSEEQIINVMLSLTQ